MSEPQPARPSPAKSSRNPVERVIVQGGIGLLLIIVAIEGWSWGQMKMAHSRLTAELKKAEDGEHKVTRKVVDEILKRQPDESKTVKATVGEERYDVYYFKGLIKQREIYVHYGIEGTQLAKSEPEVIEVRTDIPEEILSL